MARESLPRFPQVAVIGAGDATPEQVAEARRIGAGLARAGATVITGGLGGVMEAAMRGARDAGGAAVAILPGERLDDAHPGAGIALATGFGDARNVIVAGSARVVIAVGGRLGTLTEIAFARKRGIPVIGLGSWEIDPARAGVPGVIPARDPDHAVALALERLRGGAP